MHRQRLRELPRMKRYNLSCWLGERPAVGGPAIRTSLLRLSNRPELARGSARYRAGSVMGMWGPPGGQVKAERGAGDVGRAQQSPMTAAGGTVSARPTAMATSRTSTNAPHSPQHRLVRRTPLPRGKRSPLSRTCHTLRCLLADVRMPPGRPGRARTPVEQRGSVAWHLERGYGRRWPGGQPAAMTPRHGQGRSRDKLS